MGIIGCNCSFKENTPEFTVRIQNIIKIDVFRSSQRK
jgi:hypothetical protein